MMLPRAFAGLTAILIGLFQAPACASMGGTDSKGIQSVISAHQAELDARKEFKDLSRQGLLSAEDKADYQAYIDTLWRRVKDSCRRLNPSQQTIDRYTLPCTAHTQALPNEEQIDHQAPTHEEDQSQVLNEDLNNAFGEFDELLLKEMEKLERQGGGQGGGLGSGSGAIGQQSGSGSGQGQSGDQGEGNQSASSGQQSGQQSGGQDGNGQQSAGGQTGTKGQSGQGTENQTADGTGQSGTSPNGDPTGTQGTGQGHGQGQGPRGQQTGQNPPSQGGSRSTGRGSAPEDIPDGADDDIVARQLREAAERETDPDIRARLWEEYRRYKAGQ